MTDTITEVDLRYLNEEMNRILSNTRNLCKLIDTYELNNAQEYLNFLDELNEISIRN